MTKDRVSGLIALILGCAIAGSTSMLPASSMAGDIGPKVFPYISAGLLIICGAGLCITGGKKSEVFYTKQQLIRLISIFAAVLVYVILMNYIGYLPATLIGLFVLCSMFSQGKGIATGKRILYTVVVTAVLYLVFVQIFKLPLPKSQLF